MRFIDFFAGIGGATLGLQKAGMQLVDALEVQGQAKKVYHNNFGLFPKGDLMNIPTYGIEKADLFYASFPFIEMSKSYASFIGEDPDSFVATNLYFYFFDFVAYHKPKYLIIEIVKNITKAGERHLNLIYKILSQLGYKTATYCINYRDYGLPISKEVVYLIAVPRTTPAFELEKPKRQLVVLADFFKNRTISKKQVVQGHQYKLLKLPYDSHRSIYYTGFIKTQEERDVSYHSRTFPYNQRIYSDSGFYPCFQACEKQWRYFIYQEVKNRVIKLNDRQCYSMKGFPSSFAFSPIASHACTHLAYASSPRVVKWLGEQIIKHDQLFSIPL